MAYLEGILAQLKILRGRIDQAIAALEGETPKSTRATAGNGRRRRHMSPAARRRISKAMKRRWAERKKKQRGS